jgi:hypothetical protein
VARSRSGNADILSVVVINHQRHSLIATKVSGSTAHVHSGELWKDVRQTELTRLPLVHERRGQILDPEYYPVSRSNLGSGSDTTLESWYSRSFCFVNSSVGPRSFRSTVFFS